MTDIWLGLLSGIVFGFIIQRAGATDPNRMALGHLMRDPAIPRLMVLTVAVAAVGVFGLSAAGVGRTVILPTSLVATGLGGLLFGAGWGLAGYCPGTTWAAVGEGRLDAVFALLGGFAGAAAFAHVHESLIPMLYSPTSLGPVTLTDLTGSAVAGLLVMAGLMLAAYALMGRFWNREEA